MRPAKLCFAPVGDCIPDRNDPPPQEHSNGVPPPPYHRHFGIFIPPAHDFGIVNWRWRNENVRNPLTIAGLDSDGFAFPSDSPPAVVGRFRTFSSRAMTFVLDIQILSAQDENSGMTMKGDS